MKQVKVAMSINTGMMDKKHPERVEHFLRWQLPGMGWVKLNTDGGLEG